MLNRSVILTGVHLAAVFLSTCSTVLSDDYDSYSINPTAQQYEDATRSMLECGFHPAKDQTLLFVGPPEVDDSTLSQIPDLPFSFGLHLSGKRISNKSLRELRRLSNLTVLHL